MSKLVFHLKFEFSDRVDSLADRQKTFFGSCRKLKAADREEEFEKIREEYKKVVEDANEKVQISEVSTAWNPKSVKFGTYCSHFS